MNRTDRLHAVAEELRRAGRRGRTAAQLAARLEVSTRTVKRDVSALQQAGWPIGAAAGPGGGYVLDAAATLPPVNLTPAQAVAVAVALAAEPGAPWAADGRAALEKLLDVMPPLMRERAEDLARRVWVNDRVAAPWNGSGAGRVVEEGLLQRRVVVITYRDRLDAVTRRRVEPHLVAHTRGQWYLLGWCLEKDAPRSFRWDRIEAAALTSAPVPERELEGFGTPPASAHPVR